MSSRHLRALDVAPFDWQRDARLDDPADADCTTGLDLLSDDELQRTIKVAVRLLVDRGVIAQKTIHEPESAGLVTALLLSLLIALLLGMVIRPLVDGAITPYVHFLIVGAS